MNGRGKPGRRIVGATLAVALPPMVALLACPHPAALHAFVS